MSRWLLVRRDSEDPDGDDFDFYQAYGPEDTSVEELIRACQERWAIEFAFEEAKGEIGMDHYEVRKWGAWQRYVTLCLLAHAFLVLTRLAARNKEVARKKGGLSLLCLRSPVAEVRRVMLAMGEPEEEKRAFRLGWSAWRRAQQAVAKRCKKASRAAKGALRTESTLEDRRTTTTKLKASTLPPEEAAPLSDEEWEVLEPLIPPKVPAGRPYHDHRTVLGGLLWVARRGSSWREMPEEFGKWQRAYRRYELWVKQGLWERILKALGEEGLPGPKTKRAK